MHLTLVMQMTDRIKSLHFYTRTDSGLVQIGNGERSRARRVMDGNDDVIKERMAAFDRVVRIFCSLLGFPPHENLTR